MRIKMIVLICLLSFGLIACSTEKSPKDNSDSSDHTHKQAQQDLKQYSQDPDKDSDQDFDLVGRLIEESDDQINININGKEVLIPKSKSFAVKGSHNNLKNQLVKVEIGNHNQQAEEMELTALAKADRDGVYEKNDDETKIIGKYISETDKDITIQVKNGDKKYLKSPDYKIEGKLPSKQLKGKIVRLELQKNNKVKSLEYKQEDQNVK
ncbi:hypothetical protein [Heyndrickxia oleronia]|uniref:Lipoprotein n=1 Tax=Heyndrickxia oleronia TaxID=38875 RepID=A0A8E2IBA1_9BACI|nr:hypothetical protein [Heyndrickxia oleronia]NYV63921.1 hypothetical protein [Bacillus sp. Gen3]MBU5212747.1 hypothetical protein [Heyndrickxia oleronia]MCI1590618.1 hypothetical protein [Heyndrickxia oleronia]MCI1614252.1 hypothetical protein [Heyndrickxia oleronia]MCI1745092.1 hypothetical protein [Heyndrickxia oleronia]